MQRCPYLYEMKERLLLDKGAGEPLIRDLAQDPNQPVRTIVQLNPDGFGSRISLDHAPVSCDLCPLEQPNSRQDCNLCPNDIVYPKNAKTSLFIVTSFIYAKLLVVICIAYVISQMITNSIPHYYYEGFFTYLYGVSILFLLYVFCFLLQESCCCSGSPPKEKKPKPVKEKKPKKEKPPKKEKEKADKEEGKAVPSPPAPPASGEKGALSQESYPRKQREKFRERQELLRASNNQFELCDCHAEGVLKNLKKPETKESNPPEEAKDAVAPAGKTERELEAGTAAKCRRKTTQNQNSFGSFFLRMGAIAFGLGTMISVGLEIGKFFEVPLDSPCSLILDGVNPLLQLIFTFMQMYFIFMNARLNIHRFKFIARFGLMHVVATNLCVWIRTLIVESLKEITQVHSHKVGAVPPAGVITQSIQNHTLRMAADLLGDQFIPPTTRRLTSTASTALVKSTPTTTQILRLLKNSTPTTTLRATTPSTTTAATFFTPSTTTVSSTSVSSYSDWNTDFDVSNYTGWDSWLPNAEMLIGAPAINSSCKRVEIMGTIVQDAAPYLYPFIIEYSLIAAAVLYVMWRHIGHKTRLPPGNAVATQHLTHHSHPSHRVDCLGSSKGLFFGLLLLVFSLISLILYFVLINHLTLSPMAVFLADAAHGVLLLCGMLAVLVGFCRIRGLRWEGSGLGLSEGLLRFSAVGVVAYGVFGAVSGARWDGSERVWAVGGVSVAVVVQVILQLLFISDASRRRVYLLEHDRIKPGRQIITFLLILNLTMWIIYTFEARKVLANPVQIDFYGYLPWILIQRVTLPLCIFHRFYSAVALAEIWKTTYKPQVD